MTADKKFEHNFNQHSQYSEDTIKQFESTFGRGYMSAGGHETSLETAKLLAPVLARPSPTMLEVGCGIGGASFFFATEYGAKVHGVDINDVGIQMAKRDMEANPLSNGECKFETLDVTSDDCHFEEGTFDIIYSRDVILHLDHEAKLKLFTKFKTWLKPGGMICICDYCLGPKSAEGVTPEFQKYLDTRGYHLLTPANYAKTFVDVGFETESVEAKDCALWYCEISRKEIDRILAPGAARDAFLANKNDEDVEKLEKVYLDKINMTLRGDRSYVMVTATKSEGKNFEHNFNQHSQYSEDTIKQFESTFGRGYMSAGGYQTSLETAKLLAPVLARPSPTMLEVGCGIGGASFFFATEYGAKVHGVDINDVGIQMAKRDMEANPLSNGECKFETLDVTSDDCHFEEGTFDIIYSRDVILHLDHEAKLKLFTKFKTWLKPGGMICICDYCLGPKSAEGVTPEFQKYLDTRGYHLLTPANYAKTFVDVGFETESVEAKDCALWYCEISRKEIDRILAPGAARDAFLANKNDEDVEKLEKVYLDKINMTLRGDRSYVMVTATKTQNLFTKRKEVCDAYKTVSEKNFIMSCDGNVSCRVDENSFLITPSGVVIEELEPSKIAHCDNNGIAFPGEYKPSSEFALHASIYKARPDVNAIVHIHSIYACALACCRLPLPPAHYAVCELLGPFDFSSPEGGSTAKKMPSIEDAVVRCAPYHTYGSKALAEVTSEGLGNNHAVLMANHGAIVVGVDMDYAMYNAERLERECEIYWRTLQMQMVGPPKPLTMQEINDLHKADETYGQEHPQEVSDEVTASLHTDSSES